jgi:hypothetical protein
MNEGAGLLIIDKCLTNNGALTGIFGATLNGQACKITLNSGGINIGTPSQLQFTNTSPFTISIWFYATSNTVSDLFGYSDGVGIQGWYADWSGTASGKINFDFTCNNSVPLGGGYYRTINTTALSLNKWYCGVFTHDGANASTSNTIYINGIKVAQTQSKNLTPNGVSYVGLTAYICSKISTAHGFGGNENNCKVWNRVLTPNEIIFDFVNPYVMIK